MELTEEHKKKLKQLQRSSLFKGIKLSLKTVSMIFAANVFITILNVLYVQSTAFYFVSSFATSFFIFRSLGQETRKENDRVKEEVKKILES